MATGVDSLQLRFHTIILSKLTGNIGAYIKHKSIIILILRLITTHINFPLYMSLTPRLTPKIGKEEKNILSNQGKRAMYSEDYGFPCSPFDYVLSTMDSAPIDPSMEASPKL